MRYILRLLLKVKSILCRSRYVKYECFLTQYRTLTNGVELFVSISRKKEVVISSEVAAAWEATTNDDSRPVKRTHFCKLNDETVSPGCLSMFIINMNY